MNLLIWISFWLGACATSAPTLNTIEQTDPVISETIETFKRTFPEVPWPNHQLFMLEGDPSQMVDDSVTGKVRANHAVCYLSRGMYDRPRIYLYRPWYANERNIWYKRKVIMHELGHCLLGLRHTDGGTIMRPTLSGYRTGPTTWVLHLQEMRNIWLQSKR